MSVVDKNKNRVEILLRSLYLSSNVEVEREYITELSNLLRQGNASLVLDNIKNHLKRGQPEEQIKSMTILDELMLNCGPQFAIMLSSDKWNERFFKVAKACTSKEAVYKIIATLITWYKRYRTSGFQRCLLRFARSKGLGETFTSAQRQLEAEGRISVQRSVGDKDTTTTSSSSALANRHRTPNNVETVVLEAQRDLASLEYALEHPHILQDDDIAKECKQQKMKCMRLLETGDFEEFAPELMQLIERFSEALEIFEAMTGVDMGEGEKARMRAMNEEADSEEEDHQKRIHERAAPKQNVEEVMLRAQQATQQLVEKERNETTQLRTQLEELRRKHEELQNKYKDAKAKNKGAVAALEEYADRLEALEAGEMNKPGKTEAGKQLLISSHKDPHANLSSTLISMARHMRDNVQAIRQTLREIREQHASDIQTESEYYSSQLTTAVVSIVAAAQKERSADQKALHWTQELYKKEMRLRKQYYNTIQELKGNIRVYCRVRPMLPKEIAGGHTDTMTFPSTDELRVMDPNGRLKLYEFDEVYPPDAPQSEVFEDTSPLIDSVVDGYNVCIFAYGQTGTGKTYTMGGGDGDSKGINARALERLFSIIEERKETEDSTVTVSVLEIYIENIRDLLISRKDAAKITYEVKQGGAFGTYVSNLSEVPVVSPEEIHNIMERANMNRSEGQTNMNEHSSRSHMIVYIIVRTRNKHTGIQSYGKLSLVDLAGSERLDKSGAEGQLLKEAVSINKSLSSLGDVIAGLSQNNKHVPFRNSTLTYLLQDSMAGQAKVLMFVCVSPASYNSSESNSSLQFATRARGVMFGQIKKNATTTS